ncbi:hypothetical protein [Mycolicibacterium moriokaense]|uniref:Uncharacterized protein n=1 Tax=Mycolicibacterium moriokaense TaxID=39691 RepID=A0AAD1HGY4_9MYCO|nr:hypothetical protein [Mycolicibacterium moriokaense]BBX03908.1 hypothetical protein MMOR_48440 [Mycolicibacterium moriokaense]
MTPTEPELETEDLEAVAWRFLRSEFSTPIYADWPIDRRIEAYLQHHEASDLLRDGSFNGVLEHVMANIGAALRNGVLPTPDW